MYNNPIYFIGFLTIFISCLSSCSAPRPANLGMVDALSLRPCPKSPNCVHTQAKEGKAKIKPFVYEGEMSEAKKKLLDVINNTKRTNVVSNQTNYVHVEFTTAVLRFIDDVEFYFPADSNLIHFRSASRLGHSDLGANRKRMEKLRKRFIGEE